ncbi:MAG: hypothetical protein IV086_08890 [Hyphomonadaceae bacterium]|nr:hypothetical protein [Hyphomonadaceae bacterium]
MDLFEFHFAPLGASRPSSEVFRRAVAQGDLVYRSDVDAPSVRADLHSWLSELNGAIVDPAFLTAA